MLKAMLLAGIIAAPLGSVALLLPARRHARDTGIWPAIRRLTLAVIGTVVLAVAVTAILREFLQATRQNVTAGVAAVVVASLIRMPATRRWSARAHVCWASSWLEQVRVDTLSEMHNRRVVGSDTGSTYADSQPGA